MPTLLQINTVANWGSTGRIAEGIGIAAMDNGWESYVAYGRGKLESRSNLIRIGNDWDVYYHTAISRLFDRHGLASRRVTERFIQQINGIHPDVIHLHNIHGYYLNYPLLFEYLKLSNIPVVWTFHDCWPFTGHCAYFDFVNCEKWRTQCKECPQKESYPKSLFLDSSERNFSQKRSSFLGVRSLVLVPVSDWLGRLLGQSFLSAYPIHRIYNGIDLNAFSPLKQQNNSTLSKYGIAGSYILGVASVWEKRKGLNDFIALREILSHEVQIVLVGLAKKQLNNLPEGIVGIPRTDSIDELCSLYAMAIAFVNPTYEDNFPTTNLEALACGTPVVTYRTGGSVEAIDDDTGFIVEKGDVFGLEKTLCKIQENGKSHYMDLCRKRVMSSFNSKDRFRDYIELYKNMLIKVKRGGVKCSVTFYSLPERRIA